MGLKRMVNGFDLGDLSEEWNEEYVGRDFSIYTPLSIEKLVSFFKNYKPDLMSIEKYEGEKEEGEKDWYHFEYHDLENKYYSGWGGGIYNSEEKCFDKLFEENYEKNYGFQSKSEIWTDQMFTSESEAPNPSDKYFLELKRLIKGLSEEGIPHYVSLELTHPVEARSALIGGYNLEGKLILCPESSKLVEFNLFSKDELFGKSKKEFKF